MVHQLKTETKYFKAVKAGHKLFEVRKNDRDFRVGDYIALNELSADEKKYTGDSILLTIKYVLDDARFLRDGYVVLGCSGCYVMRDAAEFKRYAAESKELDVLFGSERAVADAEAEA